MTSADVRTRLTHALRLDVIGPEPNDPQVSEILPIAPSRWYLTGFLVPWNAPAHQKRDDEDTQGELEFGEATAGSDDDDSAPEPRAARRSHFPSSLGVSVLVPRDVAELVVTARWGDYKAIAKDGVLSGEWGRTGRSERVRVRIRKDRADPSLTQVPASEGLEIVTSVRRVRGLDDLPSLPAGTLAVSVFLVNRREVLEGVDELKDERFIFQAALTVEADHPFVSRPNPRGHERHDPDERISDVSAHRVGADFMTLPFTGSTSSRTCDLKKLTTAQDVLGTGPLPTGHYTQLRLVVANAAIYFDNPSSGPAACAASMVAPAGRNAAADISSGEVRLNREFDLNSTNATTILLDFDGDRSVRATGNGRYMMTPVIAVVSVQ